MIALEANTQGQYQDPGLHWRAPVNWLEKQAGMRNVRHIPFDAAPQFQPRSIHTKSSLHRMRETPLPEPDVNSRNPWFVGAAGVWSVAMLFGAGEYAYGKYTKNDRWTRAGKRTIALTLGAAEIAACAGNPSAQAETTATLRVRDIPTNSAEHTKLLPGDTPGVLVEFFNNTTATGEPQVVQIFPYLDVATMGFPAEGIGMDFSARFSGVIVPPVSTNYKFAIDGDDSVRFTFNGATLADDWKNPDLEAKISPSIYLEKGVRYPFQVQIFDHDGLAKAHLLWQYTSPITHETTTETVPPSAFIIPAGTSIKANPVKPQNEICVPDLSDPDSQVLAGTPVPPTVRIEGNREALEQTMITSNEIIGGRPDSVRVVIIPVGYNDASQVASRIQTLQSIVDQLGLNVSYSYLNKSLPIRVDSYSNILDIERNQISTVVNKIKAVQGDHAPILYMFDVNTDGRGYSWNLDDGTPFIVVNQDRYLYAAIHELSHVLGLDDGYINGKYYAYGDFPNTEFYLANEQGNPILEEKPRWQQWLSENPQSFVPSESVCLGEPVLRMEGGNESIMNWAFEDNEMFSSGRVNPELFTDFQLWIMQETIKNTIK